MRRRHTELDVWRQGIALVKAIYEATVGFPEHERYGLTSQLRRASVSASANIAEGAARSSRGEFRQFLTVARGSLSEVEPLLVIAREVGYLEENEEQALMEACDHLSALLNGLITSVERRR